MTRITIVDAFTGQLRDRLLRGNPAAVVVLTAEESGANDDIWRQDVASEMNLSETAFVTPRPDGDFNLRWFTPLAEVRLCGHATLAAAHVLWEERGYRSNFLKFHYVEGILSARRAGEEIELDFPAVEVTEGVVPGTVAALGLAEDDIVAASRGGAKALVEVRSVEQVAEIRPDFGLVGALPYIGVIVTAKGVGRDYDFASRFFAPAVGVPEDPVTGSAHCSLIPYWAERLGKTHMYARQVSKRGGELYCELHGDRVTIAGRAAPFLEGMIRL